ncbi:hypothetical protein [Kitasatospora sp. NPDC059673]|uniref:hypothetical protein n=1 Tax=Kitasatospora sp. NPDC059673 TaxID=3346901 RepID=UPI003673C5B5
MLPRLLAGPALDRADGEIRLLAGGVLAVGDELHRRMAEPSEGPAARQLAAAYETLYAAAAFLLLWEAGQVAGQLWLHAALRGLLVRLHRLHRLHRLVDEPPPALGAYPAEESLAAELHAGAPLFPFRAGARIGVPTSAA